MNDRSCLFGLICVLLVTACGKKERANHSMDEWPEMESFHSVMAKAYHPFADSANLAPLKGIAEELAGEAEKWAGAPLPEQLNNEDTKSRLEKLRADARSLADQIKAGSGDKEIGDALSGLHESFHTIMEAWQDSKDPDSKDQEHQ